MKFRNANERALYRETVAAVTAAIVAADLALGKNVKHADPQYTAHLACEFGIYAVHQLRTTEKAK